MMHDRADFTGKFESIRSLTMLNSQDYKLSFMDLERQIMWMSNEINNLMRNTNSLNFSRP